MRAWKAACALLAWVAAVAVLPPAASPADESFAELAYANGGRIFSLRADGSARQLLVGPSRPAGKVEYGSVRRAAQALGIRSGRLRGRLRLAAALRPFGGVRTVRCPLRSRG